MENSKLKHEHRHHQDVGAGVAEAGASDEQTARDPVCGMQVVQSTVPCSEFKGPSYGFCSERCQSKIGPEPRLVVGIIDAVAVLTIATPMPVRVFTGKAAGQGVLFKDGAAIENLYTGDTLIVDKTGTLTEGRPVFNRVVSIVGQSEAEVLRLAASQDQGSEHPLAHAIVAEAKTRGLTLKAAQEFESSCGMGWSLGFFGVMAGGLIWSIGAGITAWLIAIVYKASGPKSV